MTFKIPPRNYFPVPWLIPWKTGRYYSCPFNSGTTTAAIVNSTIYTSPIYMPNVDGIAITSLGVEQTTAGGAGSKVRAALYEMLGDGLIGKLLQDSGAVASDGANGFIGATSLATRIPQGWYIAALCGTGGTLRWNTNTEIPGSHGAVTIVDTAVTNWFTRFSLAAADVTNIINNGFPARLPFDPNSVATSTNVPRVLVGV